MAEKPVPEELRGIELAKRLKTTCNLIETALTKFKTVENLMAAAPDLMKALPEYDAEVFRSIQPELVAAVFHPKNRNPTLQFARSIGAYLDRVFKGVEEGKKVVHFWFVQGPDLFWALDMVPVCSEVTLLPSALYTDGCEDAIDRAVAEGVHEHGCSANLAYYGYILNGNIAPPDVLIKPAVPCVHSNAMYQATRHLARTPIICMDTPHTTLSWMMDLNFPVSRERP